MILFEKLWYQQWRLKSVDVLVDPWVEFSDASKHTWPCAFTSEGKSEAINEAEVKFCLLLSLNFRITWQHRFGVIRRHDELKLIRNLKVFQLKQSFLNLTGQRTARVSWASSTSIGSSNADIRWLDDS